MGRDTFMKIAIVLIPCIFITSVVVGGGAHENVWTVGDPVLSSGPDGTFSEIAVKDPSIVFFEEKWHLFFTARSEKEYTTGYVSAKDLASLQSAPRYELKMIRGRSRYGCAPQILYYEPQGKWYLIFQNCDSNYQPVFSTTTTISKPESWSKPAPLIRKDTKAKWIDFWIICDKTNAYLFYTQSHNSVFVRTTSLEKFPGGWSDGKKVFSKVHEATHIYKVKGRDEYHMIYELNKEGMRLFGLATAEDLTGPWKKSTDRYATGEQLRYAGEKKWTEMVSHGEVIRTGYNQQMEYEPKGCRWLIQGILKKNLKGPYRLLPWKLGIISKAESSGEPDAPADTASGQ